MVSSTGQDKVEMIVQSVSHEDVLKRTAGTFVSLQECNFVFLHTLFKIKQMIIITQLGIFRAAKHPPEEKGGCYGSY